MLAFSALSESSTRVNAGRKIESAWSHMTSAQGGTKDMKKWVKDWKKQLLIGKEQDNDEAKFLTHFGAGI